MHMLAGFLGLLPFLSLAQPLQQPGKSHRILGGIEEIEKQVSQLIPLGARAEEFLVEGKIPGWDKADHTRSWAGRLPIGSAHDPTLDYYFWLWPAEVEEGADDLIIWLQGGPGCSGLSGMMTENGPVTLEDSNGTMRNNPHSWTKAANILYLDQPTGTGFSTGTPFANSTEELAEHFTNFLDNFFVRFPRLSYANIYLAGESYAGRYVPYFAKHLNENTARAVSGIYLGDSIVGGWVQHYYMNAYEFVVKNNELLHLNTSTLDLMKRASDACDWTNYTAYNLKYPATATLPPFNETYCPTQDIFTHAGTENNPLFNPYNIDKIEPGSMAAPLGRPGAPPAPFFNSLEMQQKIHATQPNGSLATWKNCLLTNQPFPHGDASPPPLTTILGSVLNASPRTVFVQGQYDGVVKINSTLLALQNVTWGVAGGEQQGFSRSPFETDLQVSGAKVGSYVTERNVTLAIVDKAGHMVPADSPQTALKLIRYVLGRTQTLDVD